MYNYPKVKLLIKKVSVCLCVVYCSQIASLLCSKSSAFFLIQWLRVVFFFFFFSIYLFVSSQLEVCGLSCSAAFFSAAYAVFQPGIKPASPALQAQFFTREVPLWCLFISPKEKSDSYKGLAECVFWPLPPGPISHGGLWNSPAQSLSSFSLGGKPSSQEHPPFTLWGICSKAFNVSHHYHVT